MMKVGKNIVIILLALVPFVISKAQDQKLLNDQKHLQDQTRDLTLGAQHARELGYGMGGGSGIFNGFILEGQIEHIFSSYYPAALLSTSTLIFDADVVNMNCGVGIQYRRLNDHSMWDISLYVIMDIVLYHHLYCSVGCQALFNDPFVTDEVTYAVWPNYGKKEIWDCIPQIGLGVSLDRSNIVKFELAYKYGTKYLFEGHPETQSQYLSLRFIVQVGN